MQYTFRFPKSPISWLSMVIYTYPRTTDTQWRHTSKTSEIFGPNVASAVPKYLGLGCKYRPCSAAHFLIMHLSSVYLSIDSNMYLCMCGEGFANLKPLLYGVIQKNAVYAKLYFLPCILSLTFSSNCSM